MDKSRYLKFLVNKNLGTSSSVRILPKFCLPKSSRSYVTVSPILAQSQEGRFREAENSDTMAQAQQAARNDQNFGYTPRQRRFSNAFENSANSAQGQIENNNARLAYGNFKNYGYRLEQNLFLINNDIRRYGRVDPKILHEFLALLNPEDKISSPVALTLLKCCGSHLPMYTPKKRVEMMHQFWNVLKEHNFKFDISHYNSLLLLYLENEHQFSPVEILAKLEKEEIEPNRVTFQRLIKRYAQMGDMDGVGAILEHMKSLDMPITEQVCTSLLFGNIKIKNENEVKEVLDFMKSNGIEPSSDCYVEMMSAYAENGDFNNVERILAEQSDITFDDKDLLKILYTFVKNGYNQYTKQILDRLRKNTGYIHEALDWAMKLNAIGHPEQAVEILATVHRGENVNFGGALLQQCIDLNINFENLLKMCDLMKKYGVHKNGLEACYILAAENKDKDLATILMDKILENRDTQLRQQCFWPLVLMNSRELNFRGLNKIFTSMRDFELFADVRTLSEWMWPHLEGHVTVENMLQHAPSLNSAKLVTSYLVHALNLKDKNIVDNIVEKYGTDIVRDPLLGFSCERYMHLTGDVESVVEILKRLYSGYRPGNRYGLVDYTVYHYLSGPSSDTRWENGKELLSQLLEKKICINVDMLTRLIGLERLSDKPEIVDLLKKLLEMTNSAIESNENVEDVENIDSTKIIDLLTSGDENELRNIVSMSTETKLSHALHKLCETYDTEKILKLVQIMDEFNKTLRGAVCVKLMSLFLRNFDVENSLKFYNLFMKQRRSSSFFMNKLKIMDLINLLTEKRMYDELERILNDQIELKIQQKEMSRDQNAENDPENQENNNQQKNFYNKKNIDQQLIKIFQQIFNDKKLSIEKALKIFGQICDLKFYEIDAYHTNQIIDLLINKGDTTSATAIFEKLVTTMKKSTASVKLIQALAEKNDVANLQKVFDLLTSVIGENKATLKLAVSLASINKMKEAMKIMNTPTIYLPHETILQESRKLVLAQNVKGMESLLHITKHKSPQIRDTLYQNLLYLYRKLGDHKSALNCWTLIQEENFTPSKEVLTLIETILKEHNQPVPFSLKSDDEEPKKPFEATNFIKKKSLTSDLMQKLSNKRSQPAKNEAQKLAN